MAWIRRNVSLMLLEILNDYMRSGWGRRGR
jgi:hypothetical protein